MEHSTSLFMQVKLALAAASEVEPDEHRARKIAFDALMYLRPNDNPARIGMRLGFDSPMSARANVESAKRCRWWDDSHVDHVIGSFVTATRDGVETFSDQEAA